MNSKEIKSWEEIVPHEGGKINSISVSKTGELRGIDIEPGPEAFKETEQLEEVTELVNEDFDKQELKEFGKTKDVWRQTATRKQYVPPHKRFEGKGDIKKGIELREARKNSFE